MDSSTTSVVSSFLEAAYEGDINRMKDLLSSNSDLSVNVQDYDKRTPLHLAAAGGHMDAIIYLLGEGAQLKTDRFGMLPIHDAVVNQHNDIKEVLSQLDLKCDGGVCYLSPENEEALKEQVKNTNISLTPEDLETKMTQVFSIIIKEGVLAAGSLWQEIAYYFAELGLHPSYFKHFTSAQIARHLHCLIAAKKVAEATESDYIHFEIEDADSAFYLTTMEPEKVAITDAKVAEYINTAQDCGFSVTFLKSEKPPMPEGKFPLGVFVVDKQQFDSSVKFEDMMDETDLQLVATPRFLQERSVEVQKLYQTLIDETMATRNTVVKVFDAPANLAQKSGAQVLQLAAFDVDRKGSAYISEINECFRSHNVEPKRFYVDSFANGVVTYTCFFDPTFQGEALEKLAQTLRYVSHFKHNPRKSALVWELVLNNMITPEHAIFLITAAKFIFSFFPKETEEYLALADYFKNDPSKKSELDSLFRDTMANAITYERIYDALSSNYELTLPMFDDFKKVATGLSKPFYNQELADKVDDQVGSRFDAKILKTLLKLSAHLQMTNFFKAGTASAIAMRFDGEVLADRPRTLFPRIPYAVYLVVGRSFYGFHIRFTEIARGGIRLILSRNRQVYKKNCATLLEENYNLAFTQQLKNKDIPEGGSKGTILMDMDSQNLKTSGRDAFNSYVDALLDCILAKETGLHSNLSKPEMLFFGPDENTAGFMKLGALRAKARGYKYWKSLTTGKSAVLGGIPHDKYAMTTNSIHPYVVELLTKLGVEESNLTKVMSGGPDGDLGSNEILISKDKTIAICDGTGVAYDPQGLNREELTRLAHLRVGVANFSRDKLSSDPKAFLVTIDDKDVTLPNGDHFKSGVEVRNHFPEMEYFSADLFIPCGGRPGTINIGNVDKTMFNPETKELKFKYVVEGANLFLTDDARRYLEDAGVQLFKDASTNKGGVTSSSMEVFAALSMDTADHDEFLCARDETSAPPEFYEQYVQEILAAVRHNAKMEFNGIWKTNHEVKYPDGSRYIRKTDATILLSKKINDMQSYILGVLEEHDPENDWMVRAVLRRCVPRLLLVHCGLDKIVENTPEAYLNAMVATWIADEFVYSNGLKTSEFAFFQFMRSLEEKSEGEVTPSTM